MHFSALCATLLSFCLQRWYIIGSDAAKQKYRVLKVRFALLKTLFLGAQLRQIDRTLLQDLVVVEDPVIYSFSDIQVRPSEPLLRSRLTVLQDLLTMIGDANGQNGGIKKAGEACAIIGFYRFLRGYYMLFATKRKCVGTIGKHKIYSIEATQDFYVPNLAYGDKRREAPPAGATSAATLEADEEKYRNLFLRFDLTKDFYFSYTYDLSSNLQFNMTSTHSRPIFPSYNEMFVWNHYLLEPLHNSMKTTEPNPWICPVIHGSFVQHSMSLD